VAEPTAPAPAVESPQPPAPPPALYVCLFELGGGHFAVDVRSAREVAVFEDITAVPRAPACLLGLANLRGTVMPIVDIRPLVGAPPVRPARAVRSLVIHDGDLQAAVVVDGVLGLEPFEQVLPADGAHAPWREFALGQLQWRGGAAVLLDGPRLLAALRGEMGRGNTTQGDAA
jgi:purine-binding chemotaxis protein CheW